MPVMQTAYVELPWEGSQDCFSAVEQWEVANILPKCSFDIPGKTDLYEFVQYFLSFKTYKKATERGLSCSCLFEIWWMNYNDFNPSKQDSWKANFSYQQRKVSFTARVLIIASLT